MLKDYIENDDEGNIFELINEECYYDDLREEFENDYKTSRND